MKTNQKCYTDPTNGKSIKCNDQEREYLFDNKVSPRCDGGPENVKHRSVYYSLRKNFKCNAHVRTPLNVASMRQYLEKKHNLANVQMQLVAKSKMLNLKKTRQERMQQKYEKTNALNHYLKEKVYNPVDNVDLDNDLNNV